MLTCSNTILFSELILIASRYCIFLCQFVISYPRTIPQQLPQFPSSAVHLHSYTQRWFLRCHGWAGWAGSYRLWWFPTSWLHVSLTKEEFCVKGKEIPPWNDKPLSWCKLARVFWGGLFCYMHPSKYFHCVVLSHVLACKAGTSKISPEPPVYFQKKSPNFQTKRRPTKRRNPYDGMWQMWHYRRHLYLKIRERKGPQVVNLKTWSRLQQASRLSS